MSTPRTVVHKHQTTARRELDENDLIRHMASSILLQAVEDWAGCIGMEAMLNRGETGKRLEYFRQRRVGNANYTEIRKFFLSDYGDTLCGVLSLDAETVLEKLEGWLNDYHRTGVVPEGIIPARLLSGRRPT